MESIYGIDISSDRFDVSSPSGKKRKFGQSQQGFQALVSWAKDADLFVMEATGGYHTALADWLVGRGFKVAVVNPAQVRHYGGAVMSRNKTDESDAALLAQFGAMCELPLYEPLPADRAELLALVRLREWHKEQAASIKSKLKAPCLLEFAKQQLKASLASIQAQIKECEARIRQLILGSGSLEEGLALLRTIPGIGEVFGWTILAEFGRFERFASAKQVAAYCGLNPSEKRSGSKEWRTRMSKQGNAQLRRGSYMPALTARRTCKRFADLFERLVAKGHKKMSAIGAIMHKLIRVAFGVLKSGRPFILERA